MATRPPGRTTKVTSKDSADTELANVAYTYDAMGNMTEIARGDGMKYALAYNAFGNLESIGVEGLTKDLVTYTYTNGNGRLKKITYANGDNMNATYNAAGQMVGEKWLNAAGATVAQYKYVYDGQGNIVRSIDITAQKEYTYSYEDGRIMRAVESDVEFDESGLITARNLVNTIHYLYDSDGNLTKKRIVSATGFASTQTVHYETPEDGNAIVRWNSGDVTVTSHSKTDSFGRKVFDELQITKGFVSRRFSYYAGEPTEAHQNSDKLKSSATTQLVSQIVLSDGRTLSYEYDAEERITRVTDSVEGITEYTYDALGQLLTEKHMAVGEEAFTDVNVMTYDGYGNIRSKNGVTYTYGHRSWKDRLSGVGTERIVYDAQGNPTTYLGHTLTWEKGRQLKTFDNNTYTYNANGIRTSKTVEGVKHTYVLDGAKILREEWDGNVMTVTYDNEDSVCGIVFNDTPFYFLKNLQGDVIAIINEYGDTVCRYTYDAWGKCTVIANEGVGIGDINPFRYRGYYYDREIGMYYLQSRYYDPEVGRFVNGDREDIIDNASDVTILSLNKFAYCLNDPINNEDSQGTIASAILALIKNFILGLLGGMAGMYLADVTINIAKGRKDYYRKNETWGTYIAEGVRSGALAIFGNQFVKRIIAVIGAAIIKQLIDCFLGYKLNLISFLTDIAIGLALAVLFCKTSWLKGKLPKNSKIGKNKLIDKLKSIISSIAKKIVAYIKKRLDKIINFFKNTFIKRFSISYAKTVGKSLLDLFR